MRWFRKRNRANYPPKREARAKARINRREKEPGKLAKWAAGVNWPVWRINLVIGIFSLLWLALWGRAWDLQMIEGPRLAEKARKQHVATELVSGKRGLILDRNGEVLARSVLARSIYAKPGEIDDVPAAVHKLAPLLGMPETRLMEELQRPKRKFIWLKRKIDDGTAEAVRKIGIPGIGLTREYERFYPFKHMAGQLLGFVGIDDKGLEGLERSLEDRLGVMPVRQTVQRDAMGRRFYLHDEGRSQPAGEDITLTLDMRVQFIAEEAVAQVAEEYEARWSGALVVEIASGDILAWAQYPFFNPNAYRQSSPAIYRNRLAADALEPGSTFKPLVMAIALQEKKISPNTLINCEGGKWEGKNFIIRDTSIRGILPASKVLRYSSNIGMAKIGLAVGAQQFYKHLHALGFGEHSNLPIANSKGILRSPRDWGELDLMSTSFGQSISVTALQMAQAYLTFLNGGVYKPLRLIADDGAVEEVTPRILNERAVRDVMSMMKDVVEAADGTGKRARVAGVEIGGKTGTAQKADIKTRTYGAGRLASFVGYFPADAPKYFILVLVDEPAKNQYGGAVAAPAFQAIASRLLTYTGILNEFKIEDGKRQTVGRQRRGLKLASGPDQPWVVAGASDVRPRVESMELPGHLAKASALVPDVLGKSVRNAVELFARAGIVPVLKGNGGRVIRQSPPPGSPWSASKGSGNYILWLSET